MNSEKLIVKSQTGRGESEGGSRGRFQRQSGGLVLACCLLPVAFSGCGEKAVTAESAPVAVKTKTVELNPISKGVRYSASIEPTKQVELAFKVSGYVDRIVQERGVDGRMRDVQAGDVVTKGAMLARVQPSEYAAKVSQARSQSDEARSTLESSRAQHAESQSAVASGKAQLAEAGAALEKARLDFDRAKNLFSSESLTKADYDAAKSRFESAEASHIAARSQVAMLEAKERAAEAQIEVLRARVNGSQAAVAAATIPLEDTALRAPISGVVLQRSVETGALVSPGKTGFVVADLTSVKAVFGVPDLAVGKLKLGSALTVTTESLPGVKYQGRITSISPSADPKSRVFEIEVTIPNPRQELKSGMIASLEVAAAAPPPPVPVVSVSAIVRARNMGDQYAVFVVEEKGGKQIARSRLVKLGEALGNTIVVLEGLSAGERVITSGTTLVLDGQAVQIIP